MMVSTKWADPGQPEDGQFGWYRGTPSRPNVDGSFVFLGVIARSAVAKQSPLIIRLLRRYAPRNPALLWRGDDKDNCGGTNAG